MVAIGVHFLAGRGTVKIAVGVGASRSAEASSLHGSGIVLVAIGLLCTVVALVLPQITG